MGGQQSMLALLSKLDRTKFRPIVILPQEGMLSEELQRLSIPYYIIPLTSNKIKHIFSILSNLISIIKLIKKEKISIIHSDFEADTVISGIACIITRIKLVWHVRLTRPSLQDSLLFRMSTIVIGVSNDCSGRFKRFKGFKSKYNTIYNGVDTDLFSVDSNYIIPAEISPGKTIITFIGQIIESKGVSELLHAIELLNSDPFLKDNTQFLFIGDFASDSLKMLLDNTSRNYDNVVHINFVRNIKDYMIASDILVLPSHEGSEGMGRVLFEAMSCSTAVIGTNIGGVREAINDECGILVAPGKPQEIVEAIQRLIVNKNQLEIIKKNGRSRAVQYFDIRKHAIEVQDVYLNILK
jgi:glycosyltransferase involved in cell wall biosynthesis